MADSPRKEKETQGVAGGQSSQLSISVPITISGQDNAGRTFKEYTKTLIINKHGARAIHPLGKKMVWVYSLDWRAVIVRYWVSAEGRRGESGRGSPRAATPGIR